MIGQTLGPYRILEKLGEGGMGEVYKARDTRLGRTVAIKVLPAGAASDPERRRRFEQEARAASALDHPHICVLHDIGSAVLVAPNAAPMPNLTDAAPVPAAPTDFLVMEFLEGQTLAQRLTKGPLPLDQALEAGAQIADALSAAHRHGIIHRDLKPANVMLTRAGVKLLDFGLAKLKAPPAGPAAGATTLATQTEDGRVMGTAPYMAPEQVEGKPADQRTDLFAFGAVLYEMVTGRRAFAGDTAASVMAAILEHDPPALSSLQPQTPPAVERVVRRCLVKDPDSRWQTAHDVADELRWIREASGSAAAPGMPARRDRRLRAPLLVAAGAVLFAAGASVTWLVRPAAPRPSPARLSVDVRPAEELNAGGAQPAHVWTPGGSRTALTWTPDGQALVFVGRRGGVQQLYVRRLDASEAKPLPGTEGAQAPAVSADGQWVAFWARRMIKTVPLGGGPVAVLASDLHAPWGLVWDTRGRLLFGNDDGRIWEIPPAGVPAPVTTVGEAEVAHRLPWPLPGGQALLYTARKRVWSWGDEQIVAYTPTTAERKVLLQDAADARYLPTGHLVFLRRGQLFAVAFDAERVEVHGTPVPVLDTVAQALAAGNSGDVTGAGQVAISGTGTLAWVPGPVGPQREGVLVAVDRRGQVSPLPGPVRGYGSPVRVSPDGRRLAVTIRTLTEAGAWTYEIGRGIPTPLAVDGESDWLIWSPDGRRLVFRWLKDGRRAVAAQPADGTAPPQTLVSGEFLPSSWTRDGRQLVGVPTGGGDLMMATLGEGQASVQPLFQTPHIERWPEISPDGLWLAYGSDVSRRVEVYVQPFPGPGARVPVSVEGGANPAWHPSGHELFYTSPLDSAGMHRMMAVTFEAGAPPRIGRPQPLFEFNQRDLSFVCTPVRCYDVAPDGQRFYTVQWRASPFPPAVTHINLIQNWFEDLKANVPAR